MVDNKCVNMMLISSFSHSLFMVWGPVYTCMEIQVGLATLCSHLWTQENVSNGHQLVKAFFFNRKQYLLHSRKRGHFGFLVSCVIPLNSGFLVTLCHSLHKVPLDNTDTGLLTLVLSKLRYKDVVCQSLGFQSGGLQRLERRRWLRFTNNLKATNCPY